MAENLFIDTHASKTEKYEQLLPQVFTLIGDDRHVVAVLANVAAALHHTFGFLWTGFYLVEGNELVLGPFQGPVACMRIAFGKGVCGSAWQKGETIVVADVEQFPGHIACSSESRSEIVVPLKDKKGNITGVLDVDSAAVNNFDEADRIHLEKLCKRIGELLF